MLCCMKHNTSQKRNNQAKQPKQFQGTDFGATLIGFFLLAMFLAQGDNLNGFTIICLVFGFFLMVEK